MSNAEAPLLTNESRRTLEVGGIDWEPKSYRCHLAIVRESDGDYSAIALNLPGAGSCGETEDEAVANAKEAILGVIRGHLDRFGHVPRITGFNSRALRPIENRAVIDV